MNLGPVKHEKVARVGRISNVLGVREHKVRSNPWYHVVKIPFDTLIILRYIIRTIKEKSYELC